MKRLARRREVESVIIKMVINGVSVNYQRVEFDDGTFEESGLPAGMKSKPSFADLAAFAMRPVMKVKSRQLK
jgi:hypothetical protein